MEIVFLGIIVFLIGSWVGSFSGAFLDEEARRSFWTGRSRCASCNKTLRWYELIPVFSYITQRGHCRDCHSPIPSWLLHIELLMWFTWLFFGLFLLEANMTFSGIFLHLITLSMLLVLAIEDWRDFTISDRLTVPMILLTLLIIRLAQELDISGYLPTLSEALLWGLIGMLFYMLQMIIPAMIALMKAKKFWKALHVLFIPFFFPFWLIVKTIFGEEKADRWISSVSITDDLPTWVGGGDVRLGILVGLIAGPLYFWWIIGIGYTLWTLFWLAYRLISKEKIAILPVAPLLFLGTGLLWVVQYALM